MVKQLFLLYGQTAVSFICSNSCFFCMVKQLFLLYGQTAVSFVWSNSCFFYMFKQLFLLYGQTAVSFVWSNSCFFCMVKQLFLLFTKQMFPLLPEQLFRTDTCPNTELSFGIPMNLLSLQPIPIRFNACNSIRQLTLSHNPSHTHARTHVQCQVRIIEPLAYSPISNDKNKQTKTDLQIWQQNKPECY